MQMKCPILLLLTAVSWRLIATTQIIILVILKVSEWQVSLTCQMFHTHTLANWELSFQHFDSIHLPPSEDKDGHHIIHCHHYPYLSMSALLVITYSLMLVAVCYRNVHWKDSSPLARASVVVY